MAEFFQSQRQGVPQQVFDTMQGVAEIRAEIRQIRAVISHMLLCQAQGRPPVLHEEPIRSFLALPALATAEDALDRLVRSQARAIGKLTCGRCHAQVQDLEGVKVERCPYCGDALSSDR